MDTTTTIANHSKSAGCVASATGECIARSDRLIAAAPEMVEILQRITSTRVQDLPDLRRTANELLVRLQMADPQLGSDYR